METIDLSFGTPPAEQSRLQPDRHQQLDARSERAELIERVRQDFPSLLILHIDDISRKRINTGLPGDVPTIYMPFSSAALREAVERLLGG